MPKYPQKMTARRLVTLLLCSPLAVQELRVRMRGWRVPLLLGMAAGLPIIVYMLRLHSLWQHGLTPAEYLRWSANTGHRIFYEMMTAEALLCLLLMPALAAATFAQDREKQRLEALLLTPLSDAELLLGKLGPIVSFMLIILCCALPVATMSFILGGVSPSDVYTCLLFIITAGIFQALLGIFISLLAKNVTVATALAYLAFAGWNVLLLAMVNFWLTLFSVLLALLPAIIITGGMEMLVAKLRKNFYRRFVWLIFFIITSLLVIVFSVIFRNYLVQIPLTPASLPNFIAVLSPIPVFLGIFGKYGFEWAVIYFAVHLAGILLIYPHVLKRLKRLRRLDTGDTAPALVIKAATPNLRW